MVADAVSRWGRLDCLDNIVGIGSWASVVDETEANWVRVMHWIDTRANSPATSANDKASLGRGGGDGTQLPAHRVCISDRAEEYCLRSDPQ